jgi:hypothetical protein
VSKTLGVLLVSRPGDAHGDAVEAELQRRRVSVARVSLNTWRAVEFMWTPGEPLSIVDESGTWSISEETSVWWRRPGWVDVDDMDDEEAELARTEGLSLFYGTVASSEPRWVDHPRAITSA